MCVGVYVCIGSLDPISCMYIVCRHPHVWVGPKGTLNVSRLTNLIILLIKQYYITSQLY